MTKSYILAMDIAQDSAFVQLDHDGTALWVSKLPTSQTGWQLLQSQLEHHQIAYADVLVVLEATGVYHLPWAQRLVKAGAEVHVLNPLLSSRLESSDNALRGHKTDRVDTAKLAEVARIYSHKLCRFTHRNDPAGLGRRQVDHARAKLREALTNLKKSVQSHLELVFPALLAANIEADSSTAARILAQVQTAGQWLALAEPQRQQLALSKRAALDAACRDTLADEEVATACIPALQSLLVAQQSLAEQLKQCERRQDEQSNHERVGLIMSIPGFGERTALVVDAYLPPDLAPLAQDKARKKKKLCARLQAMYGTDPRLKTSGNWTGQIKISKRGIRAARTALFQAAFCSLHTDPEMKAYYDKLRAKGKSHRAAIVDCMRKQLRRLAAVLLDNQPFRPKSSKSSTACSAA